MYKLIWEDQFNYEGQPKKDLWTLEVAGHGFGNDEKQYYTDRLDNAYVKDGMLHIVALKEDYQNRHYTSAKLMTLGKKHVQYGRMEVMVKLPQGKGTWPALWFLGTKIKEEGWPACGEIDLMEHVGHNPEHIHFSLHSRTNHHLIGNQPTLALDVPGILDGFHEFAMDWTDEYFIFYIDKKEIVRFNKRDYIGKAEWPFDQPFYFIMNLAIGGTWGGPIDDSIFPVSMDIKYVKFYERVE